MLFEHGGAFGLGSLIPKGRTTRFSHFPASHRLSPDFPTVVFCLPQSDSAFLLCRRAGRCCCSLQVACFKTYLKETSGFSGLSKLSTNSISTMTWAQLFQIILPLHLSPFFFNLAPTDYQLFLGLSQACLPPSIACRGRTDLVSMVLFCFVPCGPISH